VTALCEIVERDALSLLWLQQLPVPRLELDRVPSELGPYLEPRGDGRARVFFDATTDLGVPTIYGLDLADDRRLATFAACTCDLDPVRALTKVACDLVGFRPLLEQVRATPSEPELFTRGVEAVTYMGAPERRHAFAFLLEAPARRLLSELPAVASGSSADDLELVLGRLRAAGMEAVAVDLTTDEARRAGLRVVRVIVPELQPLTFRLRARYLGHPRLFEAPPRLGYAPRAEHDLNPWPQPFA
jgi:ribosomal protein S12 methylthiotransferase accessory factor